MNRYIRIGKASEILGVTPQTLRRWEQKKTLLPDKIGLGGTRYYLKDKLLGHKSTEVELPIGYARVSSNDQKKDLATQTKRLSSYCASHGWTYKILEDLGSGMNYRKAGLKVLLDLILEGKVKRLVLTHKDRLLRFGAELIFALCEAKQIEVISFEEELAQDVLEIITVFSARLYGSRSRKNKKLVAAAEALIS